MESTGVYWIPLFEILEETEGMDAGVGNARAMKNVPGRPKRDKDSAGWMPSCACLALFSKAWWLPESFES
ncbi:MAG: hypothetical protein FWG30_00380 [Eubacteriaceae bacterium]|nr:hypothetical protein [Eubacteriaceae bacterium]